MRTGRGARPKGHSDEHGNSDRREDDPAPGRRPEPPRGQPAGSWFAALGDRGRRGFRAAFAGYMLDAFDLIVLTLTLTAIGATFGVGTGATGALSTVTLSASAIGGILGGVLADKIGRARTLIYSSPSTPSSRSSRASRRATRC